ncbi:MAG: DNA repair protein RadA [Oligoflexia bacterium]|nr:DNA repair protein RadA [Oligoflexia bacterium]MBF0364817.1 DNA repair protein RadA [Oligoflexia bacterium]
MGKKAATAFICQKCGHKSSKWLGRCPDCNEWNTMLEDLYDEESASGGSGMSKGVNSFTLANNKQNSKQSKPIPIGEVSAEIQSRFITGIGEFDRVVGGGLVPGSVVLIGGEPGIGKSTLLMELSVKLAKLDPGSIVFYVSGEESMSQLADRSKRLGLDEKNFYVFHESNWQTIVEHIKKLRPAFFILDSIQTTVSSEVMSASGTVSQIREVTYEVVNYAKANNMTSFIIGHVTKEGMIAGPKILEHMVDVVIYFEGDQYGHYRMLRVIKNRFGNVNEVGIFEMSEQGLQEVKNPSQYFLDLSLAKSYGRSLTTIIEGSRTLFVEIQALVIDNKYGNGRRTTQGIDNNRLAMLVAVIEKYLGINLGFYDIYINVVGGLKLISRDSDLSIMASILSSLRSHCVDSGTIFIGEVGLTGEVRSVPMMEMRLKEIEQMNYKRVVTARKAQEMHAGRNSIEMVGIASASDLQTILFSEE